MNIAVYISGHGFGHLSQVAPVLKQIHRLKPDCKFLIRCTLPAQEIRSQLHMQPELIFTLQNKAVDMGVMQINAVEEDRDGSIQRMRAWVDDFNAHIQQEITWLRAFQASLVISDISPLAFPAAKALNIPAIGLATLDWHSIYSHWLDADDPIIRTLATAYSACDLLLTPPMAMDMPVFPIQQQIPLIAAQPINKTAPLTLSHHTGNKALVLFGGCGNPPYDIDALASMPDWLFLIPDIAPHNNQHSDQRSNMPENIYPIQFSADLRPVDAMQWVDVVLCKPGYGVLSECWATATPIAWLERPDFPEFPMLKTWLDTLFPASGMNRTDFQHGHWQAALDKAINHKRNFPALQHDGAAIAADIMLKG
ncbi:MAG: hypothetical protein Q9M16_05170 [Mariprofundus sp.]|nr:hypothetical protein [Mariprofundus sp.]